MDYISVDVPSLGDIWQVRVDFVVPASCGEHPRLEQAPPEPEDEFSMRVIHICASRYRHALAWRAEPDLRQAIDAPRPRRHVVAGRCEHVCVMGRPRNAAYGIVVSE